LTFLVIGIVLPVRVGKAVVEGFFFKRRGGASRICLGWQPIIRPVRLRSARFSWSTLLPGLAIVLLALLQAHWSLTRLRKLTPDSLNYVDVAENLLAGRGLVQDAVGYGEGRFPTRFQIPQPMGVHGPLYPLAIASLSELGVGPRDAAFYIPAAAFLGIVLLAWALMRRLYDGETGLWAALLLSVSFPLREMATTAWSEPLALFVLLLSLLLLVPPVARPGAVRLLLAGLFAGLAFATRYPLVVAVVFGGLLLLRRDGARPNLRRLLWYGLGFSAVAAPIVLRNLVNTGLLTGAIRNPSTIGFADNLRDGLRILFGEYLASRRAHPGAELPQEVAAAALMLLLAVRLTRRRSWTRVLASNGRIALVLWAVGFSAYLIVQRSLTHFDYLHPRLLSPAHLFLMLLAAVALRELLPIGRGWVAALVMVAALSQSVLPAQRIATTPRRPRRPRAYLTARHRWLLRHTTPDDLIIGMRCLDIPFLLGRPCLYFSSYPEMLPITYRDICQVARQACPRYRELILSIEGDPDDAGGAEAFGPFVDDLSRGHLEPYPAIELRARVKNGSFYRIVCARCRKDSDPDPPLAPAGGSVY
jgi:hypothetical protein